MLMLSSDLRLSKFNCTWPTTRLCSKPCLILEDLEIRDEKKERRREEMKKEEEKELKRRRHIARVFPPSLGEIAKRKGVKWISQFLVILINFNFVLILLS